jgi:hypothetical protein
MTVYRSHASQPLKWIIAFFVFIVVMGVTFSDVYGFSRDRDYHRGDNDNPCTRPGDGGTGGTGNDDNPTPTAVPEPGTLILLAGGLSALYVARRAKKDK